MSLSPSGELRVVADAVCTNCCCLCDDIALHVAENQIVRVENACELGRQWFQQPRSTPEAPCTIRGAAAPLAAALDEATRLLTAARNPLVYGLTEVASEAQRVAVGIADWLGGTFDSTTSTGHAPSILAFQTVGKVTCTLGETRHRSNLIIFWGTNVAETHPRFFSKYSAEARGRFVPRGRADRTVVLIDVKRNATAEKCDLFYQIKPGADFEALWTLRALAKGLTLDGEQVHEQTGVPLQRWVDLMARMKGAQFGAFCFDRGLMHSRGEHANCEGLFALTREMNAFTRFVARSIRSRGNVTGADKVAVWRTGFPFAINLNRGYPRYSPGEYSATEALQRREVDAALMIGSDPLTQLPEAAAAHLRSIPLVVVGSRPTATLSAATVGIQTSTYGIHSPGTAYRMDDVPLPLRPALGSDLPSELEVLQQLEARILAVHQAKW